MVNIDFNSTTHFGFYISNDWFNPTPGLLPYNMSTIYHSKNKYNTTIGFDSIRFEINILHVCSGWCLFRAVAPRRGPKKCVALRGPHKGRAVVWVAVSQRAPVL